MSDSLVFDPAAADALALLTLLAGGRTTEMQALLATFAGDERRVLGGMLAVGGGLLALLEFAGGMPADGALAELGRSIAGAAVEDERSRT